jgi:hypothetical protein
MEDLGSYAAIGVYWQVGLLFFFTTFWGFFPVFSAIFTFPQERAMLIKERASGMYRLSAYFLARTAADLPLELILPTLFITIVYWMAGLKATFLGFLLTLLVILYTVLVSQVCNESIIPHHALVDYQCGV